MTYLWRPKRDTVNPCAVCGWSAHMAIHQLPPPRGHAYTTARPKDEEADRKTCEALLAALSQVEPK